MIGDNIPISAQVVSIADCYDALTSERCYKKSFDHNTAIKMIIGGECGEFNPLLIKAFKNCADKLQDYLKNPKNYDLQKEDRLYKIAQSILDK